MSVTYGAISWNPQKRRYDLTLALLVVVYLAIFSGLSLWLNPSITAETLVIRAFGTLAIMLLHVVLVIGPLTRLDRRFLPFLYNRRHLGVATFLAASVHGSLSVFQFHALGDVNPIVSLLAGNTKYQSVSGFPFQMLGMLALLILFLMAATSHDFWLANLSAPVWKRLHMMVYVAYGLLVAHVTLGVLQDERNPVLAGALALGMTTIVGLHLVVARRERRVDSPLRVGAEQQWVDVCDVDQIRENGAHIAMVSGERVAVFRYDGKVSAVSNVCQHQNGPLGEGRIIDGCITCPWHGFQYLPETGASPPPFVERVPTFNVALRNNRVMVDPRPNPPGCFVEPARVGVTPSEGS